VTNNAANCALARSIISKKYPFIVNTRCIAHCVNLITKDILEHDFLKKVLKSCNEIVKFFNKSHQGKALLVKCAKNFNIEDGGLKTWVEMRWTTIFDAADSVLHLKLVLEKIADEHKDIVKENIVKTITSCGFFHDINSVLKVLKPLKKTILSIEASNTTFADCFIALIRLASTINC
ncbi:hypothetical protein RhiirC2_802015, partial [Rhizophagus irregularis]